VEGFAYVRVNRLLASVAPAPSNQTAFDAWVERLRQLDQSARAVEVDNLPANARAELEHRYAELLRTPSDWSAVFERCGLAQAERDLDTRAAREALVARAHVPDDYDTWKRVVGLYWLTRVPVAGGVGKYQTGVQSVFDSPLEALAVHGVLRAYAVPTPAGASLTREQVAALIAPSPDDPLGLPEATPEALDQLFAAFAPEIVVDERSADDRVGRLTLDERGRARVDTSAPTLYRRLAHTRYQDRILVQLVYSVWFPARPKTDSFDLLGGHLDGLVWRVTLAPDGEPVLFDSIHSCGCYHQFFPTPRAEALPALDTLDEQAFVPQRLPQVQSRERVTLRVASATHFLERVSVDAAPGPVDRVLVWADDATLRSLPVSGEGKRSAFREDGIVAGSERGERWVLWPMGVREPGAMRQWGRHATAFIGRRHFDEAHLVERYFRVLPPR
jgi:hypothetical protein